MNTFIKMVVENPPSFFHAIALAASLIGLLATFSYAFRVRRLTELLRGPIPKMHEVTALTTFRDKRRDLKDGADTSAMYGVFGSFVCLLLLFLLWGSSYDGDDQNFYFFLALWLQAATLVVFVSYGLRMDNRLQRVLHRPELVTLKYHDKLLKSRKVKGKGKSAATTTTEPYFSGSLDDFSCELEISDDVTQVPNALGEDWWSANHRERPLDDEPVLIIWRDGTNKKLKMVVSKISAVSEVPAEKLVTSTGTLFLTAAGERFCGGKVASFCGKPDSRIERGWLATADRAHVLLNTLRWLDSNQRQFGYQLINPGKAYPPDL